MKYEEIIKALECCSDELHFCAICPQYLHDKDNDYCSEDLHKQALDLIKHQQEEIEKLKSDLNIWKDVAHQETNYVEVAKSEAVKEFAEKLISIGQQDGAYDYVNLYDIDKLVKEMVGETK